MIKPPNYRKDAVISSRGWKNPGTGELLVARRFTKEDIALYNSGGSQPAGVMDLREAPANNKAVYNMPAEELQELSAHYGVEEDVEDVVPAPKKTRKKKTKKTLSE